MIDAGDLPLGEVDPRERGAEPEPARRRRSPRPRAAKITLRQLEDMYIEQMLGSTGGKKGEAARLLGIDRKTLYRRDPSSSN